MGTASHPDAGVVELVRSRLVPLRVRFDSQPLARNLNLSWTPTLITLDGEGKEHHRIVGFLLPEEPVPSLLLGMAKCHSEAERFSEALAVLGELLSQSPKSDAAPEAIFLRGVCGYKSTHDPRPLKKAYETLNAEYPASERAKRAYPYRLL